MVFLLSTLLLISTFFSPQAKEISSWKETGITIDKVVTKIMSDNFCKSGILSYQACVHAYNQILIKQGETTRILFPISGPLRYGQLTKENSFIHQILDRDELEKMQPSQRMSFLSKNQRDSMAYWGDFHYKFSLDTAPSIKKLILDFKKDHIKDDTDGEKDAYIASELINGLLQIVFGDHSAIFLESTFLALNSKNDSIQGIGANLAILKQGPLIYSVNINSPAEKSGLRPFDLITMINEVKISQRRALLKEINSPEKKITLRIKRGDALLDLEIEKEIITFKNVTTDIIKNTGLIKVKTFIKEDTSKMIKEAILYLESKGVASLVLDLRENRGGHVKFINEISGFFMGSDRPTYYTTNLRGRRTPMERSVGKKITDLPLALLINAGSASSSELLSFSLADNYRALLVGKRTFGKGTIQGVYQTEDIPDDSLIHAFIKDLKGVFLKITVARFHRASGDSNQLVGITPHIEIDTGVKEYDQFSPREENMAIAPLPPYSRPTYYNLSEEFYECIYSINTVEQKVGKREIFYSADTQLLMAINAAECLPPNG